MRYKERCRRHGLSNLRWKQAREAIYGMPYAELERARVYQKDATPAQQAALGNKKFRPTRP